MVIFQPNLLESILTSTVKALHESAHLNYDHENHNENSISMLQVNDNAEQHPDTSPTSKRKTKKYTRNHQLDGSSYRDGSYRDGSYRDGSYRDGSCVDGMSRDGSYLGASSADNPTVSNGSFNKMHPEFAKIKQETARLQYLRIVLLVFLLFVAIGAAFGVYAYGKHSEQTSFLASYTAQSTKITGSVQSKTLQIMEAMDSLSTLMTLYGIHNNVTWPFVTVPDSAHYFDTYLSMIGAVCLQIMPIIGNDQRTEWEQYSFDNQIWIDQELHTRQFFANHTTSDNIDVPVGNLWGRTKIHSTKNETIPKIHTYVGLDTTEGPWVVSWLYAPVIHLREVINFNHMIDNHFIEELHVLEDRKADISLTRTFNVTTKTKLYAFDTNDTADVDSNSESYDRNSSTRDDIEYNLLQHYIIARNGTIESPTEPIAYIRYPIANDFPDHVEHPKTVAVLSATIYWKTFFTNQLPQDSKGIHCVVSNSHNQSFTYKINGVTATFVGTGDLHETKFTNLGKSCNVSNFKLPGSDYFGASFDDNSVSYTITVYPSQETANEFYTVMPFVYAFIMILIFLITAMKFILYNWYVERRQKSLMTTALKSNAVISSIFPSIVRDRLLQDVQLQETDASPFTNTILARRKKNRFGTTNFEDSILANNSSDDVLTATENNGVPGDTTMITRPRGEAIADFYPDVTIMFADICGFTAWCSEREPAQVFILLESIFSKFDSIAKRLDVFKVETVGDCYVAVCGLPKPNIYHAVKMSRFAKICLSSVSTVLTELTSTLGPGTGNLKMRFGIHSGSVTAGIVRGNNARFQLFGDSVNMASRMESTSIAGRIQISNATATLLRNEGKGHWIKEREEKAVVKGKGVVLTYWLVQQQRSSPGTTNRKDDDVSSNPTTNESDMDTVSDTVDDKLNSLVSWNVDMLTRCLQQIVRCRTTATATSSGDQQLSSEELKHIETKIWQGMTEQIKQATESTFFPTADWGTKLVTKRPSVPMNPMSGNENNDSTTILDPETRTQLQKYVHAIYKTYRNTNPFHNYDHASHVTMSVTKLLARITTRGDEYKQEFVLGRQDNVCDLLSDPLTQFACVLSAMIHDCDHSGVPNVQLVREETNVSQKYNGQSVAERNSMEIAFSLLISDEYEHLRHTIYKNEAELLRFRQLVINSVLATDIVDSNLKEIRNSQWDKAFTPAVRISSNMKRNDLAVLKATIVIQYLMQASDVAHTMQHWHVYRKWNERYFLECYRAYVIGRAEIDPSRYWFDGELGFFDHYIIPLANRLKDCGVFGVSSDEYLDYALRNRREWAEKGPDVVAEMAEKANLMYGSSGTTTTSSSVPIILSDQDLVSRIVNRQDNEINLT